MFDTLNTYGIHFDKINENLFEKLTNTKIIKSENGFIYSGYLDNLKISYNQSSLFIKGSLSKYYFGNNQMTLTIKDTKEAIEEISNAINYDVNDDKITRLDIAQNIIVSNPPESYYNFLVESKLLKRLEMSNSLIFSNSKKLLIFYNKLLEQKKYKIPIMPLFKNKNVLRYELRMFGQSKIREYFDCKSCQLRDLYNPLFFKKANDAWFHEFNSIVKANDVKTFNDIVFRSSKKFIDQLALKGIESLGGLNKVFEMIDDAKDRNVFERQDQVANLKRNLKKFNNMSDNTFTNKLVEELENKINEIYKMVA